MRHGIISLGLLTFLLACVVIGLGTQLHADITPSEQHLYDVEAMFGTIYAMIGIGIMILGVHMK